MKFQNILETIGNTPVVKINKLYNSDSEVWIKLEKSNPGGSIKDRIALAMIEDAEAKGLLNNDSVIIEPTSGNTGIGLSLVAAVKGYKLVLVMPESMSVERRKIMEAYGAEFVLTPREKGMKGAIEKANELAETTPNSWIPKQFDNPANVKVHTETTAQEILKDFPEGLDYIITGVGTGGHITGIAKAVKQKYPNVQVIAVEPVLSPVLSGGEPGPHPLQGLGAGFVPSILDTTVLDGIVKIGKEEAFEYAIEAAKKEGLFVGISTGAALAAVAQKLPEIPAGSKILTINYDTGERYLSIEGLF
ncbi:cysteine synthase A [Elizabethkingia meningoseptica]|uniref:cysteine synthase A n=1 Tax=Elizabethkingia meningoseptica TaxID=238 RepID=UPI000332C884|nr:cysteine synthase A [Elizabethkingia meningoseptica]AQX05021.1 cysteine synthase A [Elizabethkingia meningoseptica]AQX47062.1 cysteine synthase [Elizabethkingia meningoseptica]EOR29129.1 cysteine synthase [Elizabethkingia meningoseptica ATCC 13253 = NBRC 12535]KUY17963.1 cysteine synthase [Elizabethkingia meningoseptica]MDE5489118.1 cysteine synthase A [Elizabethkingia meningoseptica]